MVFQSYTLFPWLTVQQNIQFGLQLAGLPKADQGTIAQEFVNKVGLRGFEHAYPKALSGGMKQRVAIARALANNPDVLLLDEPFGALDAQTRALMQELLTQVWEEFHKTILFVTHDVEEAIFLSDRVFVMTARPGRIKAEINVPLERPRSYEVKTTETFLHLKKQSPRPDSRRGHQGHPIQRPRISRGEGPFPCRSHARERARAFFSLARRAYSYDMLYPR